MIEFSAVSSKTVLTKFEPVPPTPENSGTCVPSGAIRTAVRSESGGNAALSETVMSAILNVPPKLGTVSVESGRRGWSASRRGSVWPMSDGKNCGPVIGPPGP